MTVCIENAEVSEDIRTDQAIQAVNQFPIINRRRVATTVHVHDGETIVLGGLTQRQDVDQVVKIPGLGDIPYVGRLFQRIEKQEKTSEVSIFISPTIVRTPVGTGPLPEGLPLLVPTPGIPLPGPEFSTP